MAKQTVNIGTAANSNNGDPLRVAFDKINDNFDELYTALGLDEATLNLGAFEFTGSVLSTTDSSAIVIDQATTITSNLTVGGDVVPSVANGGDLGTADKPWRSLYVSGDTVFIGGTPIRIDGNGDLTVDGNVVASGAVSYNDLTDTPTIPADVSDLTDTGNLLGGDTGDITFSATTISAPDDTSITIQALDIDSAVRSRISLSPDFGAVSMSGVSEEDSTTFDTNDWNTATWSSNFSGGSISIVNALAIYNFLEEDLNSATIFFSVNGGAKQPLSGRGFNFPTNTLTLSTEIVPDPDPTTVIEIEFFYTFSSRIGIDYDDSVSMSARGDINARIRSERDVRIEADQDIRIEAAEEIRIDGNDRFRLRNNSTTRPIQIITDNDNIAHTWSFESDGRLIFPDATVQTTAYTGPQTSLDGDVTGSVFADDSTLLVDGVNGVIPYSVLSGAPSFGNWTFSSNTLSENSTGNAVIQSSTFAGSKLILQTRGPTDKQWIFDQDGDLTAPGDITMAGMLTVEESFSGTPTTKFFEVETGAGNNRLLRTGVNMSSFAQQFGPQFDLTSYRSSPQDGDAGPEFVLRASTLTSVNDVIANIRTEVTDVSAGDVTSKILFTVQNNGSNVTPLTITGTTVDMQTADQVSISNENGAVDIYGEVEFNNGTTAFQGGNSVDFNCAVDFSGATVTGLDNLSSINGVDIDITSGEDINLTASDDINLETTGDTGDIRLRSKNIAYIATNWDSDFFEGEQWTFNTDGTLEFPDNTIQSTAYTGNAQGLSHDNDINITINNDDSSSYTWNFGNTGALRLPTGGKIDSNTINLKVDNLDEPFIFSSSEFRSPRGIKLYNASESIGQVTWRGDNMYIGANVGKSIEINTDAPGYAASYFWTFGADGILTIPGDIKSTNDFNIVVSNDDSSTYTWHFGNTGDLTLPGDIVHTDSTTGYESDISLDYNFRVDTQFASMRLDGAGDWRIGSNSYNHRIRATDPANDSGIEIQVGYDEFLDEVPTWHFGTDRVLTIPQLGVITSTSHQLVVGTQAFDIRTASDTAGTGYDLTIGPGNSGSSALGCGSLNLRGGNTAAESVRGGDVNINAGEGQVSGNDGTVKINQETTGGVWIGKSDGTADDIQTYSRLQIHRGVVENYEAKADATGVVEHDCDAGHLFYHTSPDANWTVNLTNLNSYNGMATNITIIIAQGDPAYYPNALQIAGSAQTILWQGGAAPTPTASGIDVVTFSILFDGSNYTVLGQMTDFSAVA